jgi:aryl-alcohol dehydrogenase-like predicted oxidoreductase
VLSRGLLSGDWSRERSLERDFRGASPRFQGANLARNLALVDALRGIARESASVGQVAIAWVLAQGSDIVPLVGARRRDRLEEALAAALIRLTPDEMAAIRAAVPMGAAAGARYPEAALAHLDSELA